jgi:pyrroline-5-carboxylate reductase
VNILIIGGGNMGTTYARSFLRAHITTPEQMMILERSEEKAKPLRQQDLGTIFTDHKNCMPQADLIVLAVKPQDAPALFDTLRPHIDPQQVFLSIMAGLTIEGIQQGLGLPKVIRAMPNLASSDRDGDDGLYLFRGSYPYRIGDGAEFTQHYRQVDLR